MMDIVEYLLYCLLAWNILVDVFLFKQIFKYKQLYDLIDDLDWYLSENKSIMFGLPKGSTDKTRNEIICLTDGYSCLLKNKTYVVFHYVFYTSLFHAYWAFKIKSKLKIVHKSICS